MKIFGKEIKLFNWNKDGKGVKKEPQGPKNLANFPKNFMGKFSSLITVNMFYIFGNFPLIFLLLGLSGNLDRHSSAPSHPMFAPIYGVALHDSTPVTSTLMGIFGIQEGIRFPTTLTYIMFGLAALIIFTFGYVNTGTTYILRNMIKGEPIFMWSDFWYAIKRNKRQGLILGIIDLIVSALCVYDIMFFYGNIGIAPSANVMFFVAIFITILWFFMRFYMYITMVTFDLSIFKIIKNAFIFSLLGLKRNFMAALGIIAMVLLTLMLCFYVLPIGIIIPFAFLIADCSYMACYAAFPKIKEIMIDPYYKDTTEEETEEPIFHDLG